MLEDNREKEFQGVMRSLRDKVYRDGTGHCEQFQVKGVGVIFFITERGGGLESLGQVRRSSACISTWAMI